MSTRYFSLIFGIIYVIIGVLGFIPSLLTTPGATSQTVTVTSFYGNLFGLFPVNVIHSIIHILIGIWGIVAYRSFDGARIFSRVTAVLFAVLTILGLIPVLNTLFGLVPLFGNDIWLHAVSAIIAAYFGWAVPAPAVTETHM